MTQHEPIDLLETSDVAHLASPLALGATYIPNFRPTPQAKFISRVIKRAVAGTGPRKVAISIPQQRGKSTISSILSPAWVIELHAHGMIPGGFCGLVSAEDSLVLGFSNQIRRLLTTNEDSFLARVRSDSRAASFWETEQGGGIIATGVGGSIVGRPITYLDFDDTTKTPEQANSEKHREKTWDLWQTVGIGRLQPWSVVLVVCVRWSEDDLIGRLLSPDYPGDPNEWEYISIPLVSNSEDDPLGRPIGDALIRPQWDDTQVLANADAAVIKSSISEYYYSTLWQQDPRDPEGTIFKERKWRFYGPNPTDENGLYTLPKPQEFDQVIMSWDMTFKDKKDSDYVVGQAWGGRMADRYLLDQLRGRWSFTETKARVRSFAERIRYLYPKANTILVEDKANGPAIVDELKSSVGGLIEFPVNEYGSKESRAWAVQPLQEGENIYIPSRNIAGWVTDFISETAAFRGKGDKNDDQVDCMTQALLYMQRHRFQQTGIVSPVGQLVPTRALGRLGRH